MIRNAAIQSAKAFTPSGVEGSQYSSAMLNGPANMASVLMCRLEKAGV
ncbi:hypothetical protein [Aquisphaera insulae]|nr:hypothetical protein [Aquisphaera insulae]